MCRAQQICSELPSVAALSHDAPLPPPQWIREALPVLHDGIRAAARGDLDEARGHLSTFPHKRTQQWCIEHGQIAGNFRFRLLGAPKSPAGTPAPPPRRASPWLEQQVFVRDGYRCRYCNLRVIPREVLKAASAVLGPELFPTGRRNQEQHGGALVSWAQVDHVLPWSLGGRTDPENLVTSCWACNYGKNAYALSQIGVCDPRERVPMPLADWDGLWSLLPQLQSKGDAKGALPLASSLGVPQSVGSKREARPQTPSAAGSALADFHRHPDNAARKQELIAAFRRKVTYYKARPGTRLQEGHGLSIAEMDAILAKNGLPGVSDTDLARWRRRRER